MNDTTIRFSTFPRTEPPPAFVEDLVNAFRQHESEIATEINDKGLRSNDVLAVRSTVKKLSVLLSLLGLLLFLATPALGDTRGGVVDSKGGPVDIHFSHVEPNEKLVVLSFVEVEGKTWAIAEHVPRYTNSLLVRLPHDAVNYDKQRVTHAVNAPDVGSIWKTHGGWVARAEAVKGHVKIYHGLQSREEAIALVLSTAMEQLDAQTVPDTGGITPGTIALAGIVLLTGGLLLIWRIVLGWARF